MRALCKNYLLRDGPDRAGNFKGRAEKPKENNLKMSEDLFYIQDCYLGTAALVTLFL